ncbi:MAG: NUDIX hydrolase [Propionibacteriaceae bacterium]|jgi:8-oxo-dGTP diphosphatase|nr:NUDIX hydrolase [Propionibacteriaceae bacterium]
MASNRQIIETAGTVTLRDGADGPEVLLEYRKRYNDWTLPKGHLEKEEYLAACAVRETQEETLVTSRLGASLGFIEYPVVGGTKRVHYWKGTPVDVQEFKANSEVNKIRWLPVEKACDKVTYPEEPALIRKAAELEDAVTVLVVRHAKAKPRISWEGPDDDRPLASQGKKQAEVMRSLLSAFGVKRLISSTAKRCRRTLKPYGELSGIQLETTHALTETEAYQEPEQVKQVMRRALRQAIERREPVAICGHQPALPQMLASLGIVYRAMVPGAAVAIHFSEKSQILGAEFIDPPV